MGQDLEMKQLVRRLRLLAEGCSPEDSPPVTMRELARVLDALDFYRGRCDLLQAQQARMRDPERTLVCDILANGQLLPDPTGARYGR
ncbi:MAG: hypothetical protein EOM91_24345 [Sphingobacteriia bacterium]|nr:hypothetical protein [Sphingobacteriia bacterium]